MGLHQENTPKAEKTWDPVALDERRRLFWCTYSLDRQVCVYLGRPFGMSDDAIKTPFPVDVDDEFITANGILPQPLGRKSSRTISLHMFGIRRLQSEIQQILYQTTEIPRRFQTLEIWRRDMEARLQHWYDTTPKSQDEAGCGFNLSFVDLNYQQTRLLLYGLCPAVPLPSPEAFEIIADSGSKIIKAYRHLHREKCINYTWLACHNLFMAGKSPSPSAPHPPVLTSNPRNLLSLCPLAISQRACSHNNRPNRLPHTRLHRCPLIHDRALSGRTNVPRCLRIPRLLHCAPLLRRNNAAVLTNLKSLALRPQSKTIPCRIPRPPTGVGLLDPADSCQSRDPPASPTPATTPATAGL